MMALSKLKNRIKKLLPMKEQLKRSNVSAWEDLFGTPRPRLAALLALNNSGSHFILNMLHQHPSIMALSEDGLNEEAKLYYGSGILNLWDIWKHQLVPAKRTGTGIRIIALNKPSIWDVHYNLILNRRDMSCIYHFRNPVANFLSLWSGWQRYGKHEYGVVPSGDEVKF